MENVDQEKPKTGESEQELKTKDKMFDPAFVALQNILIVETIATFLSVADLKAARLVNQLWHQACTSILRKKVGQLDFNKALHKLLQSRSQTGKLPLTFSSNFKIPRPFWDENYNASDKCRINKCLSTLTNLIGSSSKFPLTKFKMSTQDPNQRKNVSEDFASLEFMTAISSVVVDFTFCKKSGEPLFPENPFSELTYPNLKMLEIIITNDFQVHAHAFKSWTQDRIFLQNLIEHAPKLNTMSLESPSSTFITQLLKRVNKVYFEKLQHLTLQGHIDDNLLALLATMKFDLKTLALQFRKSLPNSAEHFTGFLSNQSKTLTTLLIRAGPTNSALQVTFPEMMVLDVLNINVWSKKSLNFNKVSFAQQFPALKKLSLDVEPEDISDFINSEMLPLETVKVVQFSKHLRSRNLRLEASRIFPKAVNLLI